MSVVVYYTEVFILLSFTNIKIESKRFHTTDLLSHSVL